MSTVFDFAPLSRFGVGFDRLFDMLDQTMQLEPAQHFPPYDIERTGEDSYRVTLAVAGYAKDELSITGQQNLLIVAGKKPERQGVEYLYRGMAGTAFERRFNLADYVKVADARLENGLLTIELVRELPDEMKPRQITIATGPRPKLIENQAA